MTPLQLLDFHPIGLNAYGVAVGLDTVASYVNFFIPMPLRLATNIPLASELFLDICTSDTDIKLVQVSTQLMESALLAAFTHPMKSNVWSWREGVLLRKQALVLAVPALLFSDSSPREYLASAKVVEVGLMHVEPHGPGCKLARSRLRAEANRS